MEGEGIAVPLRRVRRLHIQVMVEEHRREIAAAPEDPVDDGVPPGADHRCPATGGPEVIRGHLCAPADVLTPVRIHGNTGDLHKGAEDLLELRPALPDAGRERAVQGGGTAGRGHTGKGSAPGSVKGSPRRVRGGARGRCGHLSRKYDRRGYPLAGVGPGGGGPPPVERPRGRGGFAGIPTGIPKVKKKGITCGSPAPPARGQRPASPAGDGWRRAPSGCCRREPG